MDHCVCLCISPCCVASRLSHLSGRSPCPLPCPPPCPPPPSPLPVSAQARSVCVSYLRSLCWTAAYYWRGTGAVAVQQQQPGSLAHHNHLLETADLAAAMVDADASPDSPPHTCGSGRGRRGKQRGSSSDGMVGYASWRCEYPFHYAPLASDLSTYGRAALRMRGGAGVAGATNASGPIKPFSQLMAVLPLSRLVDSQAMPACLPRTAATHNSSPLHCSAVCPPACRPCWPGQRWIPSAAWRHCTAVAARVPLTCFRLMSPTSWIW